MYKIGDKVRVIRNTTGHQFKIGEIVEIKTKTLMIQICRTVAVMKMKIGGSVKKI